MELSLSFFSSHGAEFKDDKYKLLVEAATLADRYGLTAVWLPERHFHAFGGIFPNPALTALLVATATERIRVRAGSIVLPLHDPIRVAEDWSVVDNVSRGRVDLSFAIGWNPNDFVLAPASYDDRAEITYAQIDVVRNLWKGNEHITPNGMGEATAVRIFPSPMQREFGVWMTCTGPTQRFVEAGRRGFNVLTALISQSPDQLCSNVAAYRQAREQAGFDPGEGCVTLTLHNYVGADSDNVRDVVRESMTRYLSDSVDLWRQRDPALQRLLERPDGLEFAFQRYIKTSGLFGTADECRQRIADLEESDIDEIACLVDFGLDAELVLAGVQRLGGLAKAAEIS